MCFLGLILFDLTKAHAYLSNHNFQEYFIASCDAAVIDIVFWQICLIKSLYWLTHACQSWYHVCRVVTMSLTQWGWKANILWWCDPWFLQLSCHIKMIYPFRQYFCVLQMLMNNLLVSWYQDSGMVISRIVKHQPIKV
jgi:hypothetical protein